MSSPVLVVGSIGLDDVETPFGRVERALGGSAVYASAAASFFAPVRFVGVAGGDLAPGALAFLSARGVDLAGLETVPGGKTFRWGGRYHFDLNARDTLFTELNVLGDFDPKVPKAFRSARFVFLGNLVPALQSRVLDQVDMRDDTFAVLDTMNFWIEGARADLDRVLQRVDCLIVNDSEARELAGESNLVKAARRIRGMGPDIIVVKKGEHGALLFDGSGVFSAPAYPMEDVVDPTGAGDAFAGGFVGHLAKEGSVTSQGLRRAVVAGSAVASLCVERFSVDGLKDRSAKDVETRVEAFRALAGWG